MLDPICFCHCVVFACSLFFIVLAFPVMLYCLSLLVVCCFLLLLLFLFFGPFAVFEPLAAAAAAAAALSRAGGPIVLALEDYYLNNRKNSFVNSIKNHKNIYSWKKLAQTFNSLYEKHENI